MKEQIIQTIAELEKLKLKMPFANEEIDKAIDIIDGLTSDFYWEIHDED
jgi:hypothetical protein